MATLALGAAGEALGGFLGGAVGGPPGAAIGAKVGGFVGTVGGAYVDSQIITLLTPPEKVSVGQLNNIPLTTSVEGAVIARVYGRARMGGNIIWATDFTESRSTTNEGGKGGGGGGGGVDVTTYSYSASFATGICAGPITGIGRLWADGNLLDPDQFTWRWYSGGETQTPDPYIRLRMGEERTPAYRGLAYAVFEEMALGRFGNRIPQIAFEVFSPLEAPDSMEGAARAVNLRDGGEFGHDTTPVRSGARIYSRRPENLSVERDQTNIKLAVTQLRAEAPEVVSVNVAAPWFGNDLRAGECKIRPFPLVQDYRSDPRNPQSSTTWSTPHDWRVSNFTRTSRVSFGYGIRSQLATPSDASLVRGMNHLVSRGFYVGFTCRLGMAMGALNTLPNPYSDNAAEIGQGENPDSARITISPAPGYAGSPDASGAALQQINNFFGAASTGDFTTRWDGDYPVGVDWHGSPSEFSYRRFVLHYLFLIGEFRRGIYFPRRFIIGEGLTALLGARVSRNFYQVVDYLRRLAEDVRAQLDRIGATQTQVGFAAEWSAFGLHEPPDGSGDLNFYMDAFYNDAAVDFVGINYRPPLADWRDGFDHLDAVAGARSTYERAYLAANVEGGEYYDWTYASLNDRVGQTRTDITDPKPWVKRRKDIRGWWTNRHYNRRGGVEQTTPTPYLPESKPIYFTALGCPAVDRGANQPDKIFHPASVDSGFPYFSRGWRDDDIQRSYVEAVLAHYNDPANNPTSPTYGHRMIDTDQIHLDHMEIRPYPIYPDRPPMLREPGQGREFPLQIWEDTEAWLRGTSLSGRLGSVQLRGLVHRLLIESGVPDEQIDVSGIHGACEGYQIKTLQSARESIQQISVHFGFDLVESGGRIVAVMRGGAAAAEIARGELVAQARQPDDVELARSQESELPQVMKWTVNESGGDYQQSQVEARRIVSDTERVSGAAFDLSVPVDEAERRARRSLMELWAARESASTVLAPSRLALDPGDVITLTGGEVDRDIRIASVGDEGGRRVEGVAQDREAYALDPISPGPRAPSRLSVFASPGGLLLDIPGIWPYARASVRAAAFADPWPGAVNIYASRTLDNFRLVGRIERPTVMGQLATLLDYGPRDRIDYGSSAEVDMIYGELQSVSDSDFFSETVNTFAITQYPITNANPPEIVSVANAELIGPRRYRISKFLREQLGTSAAAGVRVHAPGSYIISMDAGTPGLDFFSFYNFNEQFNIRFVPETLSVDNEIIQTQEFTFMNFRDGIPPPARAVVERGQTYPGDIEVKFIPQSVGPGAESWYRNNPTDYIQYNVFLIDSVNGIQAIAENYVPFSQPFTITQEIQEQIFGATTGHKATPFTISAQVYNFYYELYSLRRQRTFTNLSMDGYYS